jgi:hypothetical protein
MARIDGGMSTDAPEIEASCGQADLHGDGAVDEEVCGVGAACKRYIVIRTALFSLRSVPGAKHSRATG